MDVLDWESYAGKYSLDATLPYFDGSNGSTSIVWNGPGDHHHSAA
jgi:hypothetical protein